MPLSGMRTFPLFSLLGVFGWWDLLTSLCDLLTFLSRRRRCAAQGRAVFFPPAPNNACFFVFAAVSMSFFLVPPVWRPVGRHYKHPPSDYRRNGHRPEPERNTCAERSIYGGAFLLRRDGAAQVLCNLASGWVAVGRQIGRQRSVIICVRS